MPQAAIFAVSLASAAGGAYTQYRAGKEQAEAQANAARYQQQVEENNRMAEMQNANSERAHAAAQQSATESRIKEEQSRASQNLLRAQEEKRKALSAQRAQFVNSGVLADSESSQMVIGELGENLQTRIGDMFTASADRMAAIQNQGSQRHFAALQRAYGHDMGAYNAGIRGQAAGMRGSAARRSSSVAGTAALIGGLSGIGSSLYKAHDIGLWKTKAN